MTLVSPHEFAEADLLVGDLGLREHVLDDVVFEYNSFDFGAALTIGQIICHNLCRLLVVLRELFDARTNLLGLGLQVGGVDELGNQQAQTHAALGFGFEGFGGNRQAVGVGHATLLEVFAGSGDTAFGVGTHQRLGHVERAGADQGVHDAALGAGLCTGLDLALEVGTNVGAQLFDIAFGLTQLLGELGVELGQDAFGHFTHGDRELGGLAGDFLAAVVLGEAERERLRVTRLQTGDGRFEFGEHATLTQHEGEVLGLAAFELFAIDAADEIKRDTIAFGGRTVFARLVGGALTTQDIDRTFDVGIAHFAGAAGDF